MSSHTEGLLRMHFDGHIVSYTGEPYCNLVKESGSRALVPEAIAEKVRMSNARRLAACWNACDGVSTADLEDDISVNQMRAAVRALDSNYRLIMAERKEAKSELAAARALLAEVVADYEQETYEMLPGQIIDRIRTLLEPKP